MIKSSIQQNKESKMQTSTDSQMYGTPDIQLYIDRHIKPSMTYKLTGGNMIVAGLMSDAQELMEHGDTEGARKTLNIAKHILFEIMEGKLIANVAR
jgi:hypothetical protein